MKSKTFTVKGKFTFPVDMLRYDGAFPDTQEDVTKLAAVLEPAPGISLNLLPETSITFRTFYASAPTVDRWKSFLFWSVTHINGKPVSNTRKG